MGNTRSSSFDSGTLKADKIRASFANTLRKVADTDDKRRQVDEIHFHHLLDVIFKHVR